MIPGAIDLLIHEDDERNIVDASAVDFKAMKGGTVPRYDSSHAPRFAERVKVLFPGRIEQILTENGSEFQGAFAACRLREGAGPGILATLARAARR